MRLTRSRLFGGINKAVMSRGAGCASEELMGFISSRWKRSGGALVSQLVELLAEYRTTDNSLAYEQKSCSPRIRIAPLLYRGKLPCSHLNLSIS